MKSPNATHSHRRVQSALRLIAKHGCASFIGNTRCWNAGRKRSAKYGADRWCDACIAQDALDVLRRSK